MRANDGAWIGWPGSADDELEPFVEDGLQLVPVHLSAQEVEEFYEGFSNGTLWPLYHDLVAKPEFHREWWDSYVTVNRRFAEKAAEVAAEGATVWIQDYQLQLVPQMLRDLRPDLRIGFYLHIPFPPGRALQPAAVAPPDPRGAARRRPDRLPARRRRRQLRAPGPPPRRAQDAPRPGLPARRPDREGRGLPDLDRLRGLRGARPLRGRAGAGRRDPRGARQPAQGLPRHRPPRLHQGHRGPAARVRRADRRGRARRRGRRLRAGGHPVARAGRAVPHPARRHRPAGRAGSTATWARSASRRSPTSTRPTRARRWRRSTGPPTSWSSRPSATA